MTFQFDSLASFMQMAGHGPYVWSCYGLTALVLGYLIVSPLRRQKRFLQEQQRLQRVNERRVAPGEVV